jgi:hypothetical protein
VSAAPCHATIETGLFEIQPNHLKEFRQTRRILPASREVAYVPFRIRPVVIAIRNRPTLQTRLKRFRTEFYPTLAILPLRLACCFLHFANLPNFALDRLSCYQTTLWRQAGRILWALETLD